MSVAPENWNLEKQRCVVSSKGKLSKRDVDIKNHGLLNIHNRAEAIFIEHQNHGKYLAPDEFKRLIQSGGDNSEFIPFMEKQIEIRSGSWAPSTLKHNKRTLNLMRAFKGKLTMNEISIDIVREFDGYMSKNKLAANTRAKHHRSVKMYMLAAAERYSIENPYKNFKMPKAETERVFLVTHEVNKLIELHDSEVLGFEDQLALKRYLFSCHCGGFRISDIQLFGPDDVINDTLVFVATKTERLNKTVKVPFKPELNAWIQYNTGPKFFDVRTDQHINECLKVVAEKVGLKKNLTFHTARHTFATGYLKAGGSVEVLQKILRHSKLETTMIYVHITDDRIRQESKTVQMFSDKPSID